MNTITAISNVLAKAQESGVRDFNGYRLVMGTEAAKGIRMPFIEIGSGFWGHLQKSDWTCSSLRTLPLTPWR
jgi:hypothetical protein